MEESLILALRWKFADEAMYIFGYFPKNGNGILLSVGLMYPTALVADVRWIEMWYLLRCKNPVKHSFVILVIFYNYKI
jgi:hypothetical protein